MAQLRQPLQLAISPAYFLADVVNLSGGTATFANKNVGNNKNVTAVGLALSGADAGNYQLSSTSASCHCKYQSAYSDHYRNWREQRTMMAQLPRL